jgi:hypothetical protein
VTKTQRGVLRALSHGAKNSWLAYLVCIAPITGNPVYSRAGLGRARMSLIGCGRLSLRSRIWVSSFMPEAIRRANNAKSKICSRVEHVFAEQKNRMGAIVEQRIVRLTGIHDSMGNCNAKRRLCATLKSECPIKRTAAYC